MNEILQYLKIHGEKLDTEIAAAVGFSLDTTRIHLSELAAKHEIMLCKSTRYDKGEAIEGVRCRLAGFVVRAKPGAKPRVNLKLS